jgi:hypothetical protein
MPCICESKKPLMVHSTFFGETRIECPCGRVGPERQSDEEAREAWNAMQTKLREGMPREGGE